MNFKPAEGQKNWKKIPMTESDLLESLISSTLSAIDGADKKIQKPELSSQGEDNNLAAEEPEVEMEELLSKLKSAAPKLADPSSSSADIGDDSLNQLLEGLLTPKTILDSMEALSVEMGKYLENKEYDNSSETEKHRRQLAIYKEVAGMYKSTPTVGDDTGPEGDRVRDLLAELQTLGSPPNEVIEKLMESQLGDESGDDMAKEFQQFMKAAAGGATSLPGMTKEDEEIIKQLTQDPNALKNLLGGDGKNDCCIS